MNCADCREHLVALLEGLLEPELARQCQAHIDSCVGCRAEQAAASQLQDRLLAASKLAANVSLDNAVMQRVQREQAKPERTSIMSQLFRFRWGFGALAGAAAVIAFIVLALPGNVQAKAADVLARGAQAVAKLTSIHLRGELRTLPADNFSYISPDQPFYTIELWKQFAPDLKWRVQKPGRMAVMDGETTLLYINASHHAAKFEHKSNSAFDTEWLHRIANLSNTISNELVNAQARGWKLDLVEQTGADGRRKSVVTVHVKSGVPADDYCKNTFLDNADTRRVYSFDTDSERLDGVQIYLVRNGAEVQIFNLNQIDYDQPLDPSLWQVELPKDVSWYEQPKKLPDNDKYANLTAEQAARSFFEACAREDWTEAAKFQSPLDDRLKKYLGGLQLVSLGHEFSSKTYPGRFIPYEIKLHGETMNVKLSKDNPAHRFVLVAMCDAQLQPKEEFKWTTPPQVLPDNDTYARMSASDVVKAMAVAFTNQNWAELAKFAPESVITDLRTQIDQAVKQGINPVNFMPAFEVGQEKPSADGSATFVQCQVSQVKKWNLAIRKDNAAGRWQVDGGI